MFDYNNFIIKFLFNNNHFILNKLKKTTTAKVECSPFANHSHSSYTRTTSPLRKKLSITDYDAP